ncbi:MAG: hypothetical protein PF961_21155 [Planctomycetota bacterium]|nr:hypothetical protein [Planctomycetota bacterium]
MAKAARIIGERIRRPIADAVREAEEKTAAEFVPVIATNSDRYERAEDMAGLVVAIISLVVVSWLFGMREGVVQPLVVLALILAVLTGFIAGVLLAVQIAPLRRLFISPTRRFTAVAARARQVFVDRKVHQTTGGTGIVLYVSLFEGAGMVLADQAVRDHLPEGALDDLSRSLTHGIASGDVGTALVATIAELGNRLGDVLPRYEDDVNELPDALVLLD